MTRLTRNVSIIAHVDHGKTTLSDFLIGANRAGSACVLDSTPQEKARGITIKASSIKIRTHAPPALSWQEPRDYHTLCEVKNDILEEEETRSTGSAGSDSEGETNLKLYVGNLPSGFNDDEALKGLFATAGATVQSIAIRPKRGFAWLTFDSAADMTAALALDGELAVGDQKLLVQPIGTSAKQQLRQLCNESNWPMPTYELFTDGEAKCARIRIGGTAIAVESSRSHQSYKAAKEQAAQRCIEAIKGSAAAVQLPIPEVTSTSASEQIMTLNLVDCPGHIDFNSEVTAALRLADGAMVVVDVVEGVCAQTRTVLRQALLEGVRPVLVLNKFDRLLLELRQSPEEATNTVVSAIEAANSLIKEALQDDAAIGPDNTSWTVSLLEGSVILGSGYFGWLCSFDQMAALVAKERNPEASVEEIREFVARATAAASASDAGLRAAIEAMIVRPLLRIHRCIENQDRALTEQRLSTWGIRFDRDDWDLPMKGQLKKALAAALPAGLCMLRLFMAHLPSPDVAQRYRMPYLCAWMRSGEPESAEDKEDADRDNEDKETHTPTATEQMTVHSLKHCDPAGPTMLFIVKMVPLPPQNKHLVAMGRVYSGTVRAGDTVHVFDGTRTADGTIRTARVTRLVAFETPSRLSTLESCCAGDVCGFLGVDAAIIKSATLTSLPEIVNEGLYFNPLPFTVTPVVSVSIRPKRTDQIPRFVDAVRVITKTDPGAHFHMHEETGEHLLSGVGELHLEVLVESIKELTNSTLELDVSDPIITFRETVSSTCSTPCLAKTANKLNRLYFTAQPLHPSLVEAIELGEIGPSTNPQDRARALVSRFGWDSNHARKVLAFGPEDIGANILVDATTGLSNLNSIKDSLISAFGQFTMGGPLAGQRLRGVRIDLVDAVIHSDNAHKRPVQIVPAAKRGMQAALLSSEPRLLEPLYMLSAETPQSFSKDVCNVVSHRRGQIQLIQPSLDNVTSTIQAYLPVKDSLGVTNELRGETSGKVNVSLMSAGWQEMTSDPLTTGTPANDLAVKLRESKRMASAVPSAADFIDKL